LGLHRAEASVSTKTILGLNCSGFNSSCAFIRDGEVLFAVEEERLIRQKRTRLFPQSGIRTGLKELGMKFEDLDSVAIGWNPTINLETFNSSQANNLRFLGELFTSVPLNLMKLQNRSSGSHSSQYLSLDNGKEIKIHYVNHHLCHASCFYLSSFDEASILTVDAFGEKQCCTFSHGKDREVTQIWSQEFPHSLGAFYSTMTEYLGFRAQSDEWKLMGASSYGNPAKFLPKLRQSFNLLENGEFELNLRYFNFYQFHRPKRFTSKLTDLLGIEPLSSGMQLLEEHYDLASASQLVFEEIYSHLISHLKTKTNGKNLILSGGSALNSVANGKVLKNSGFTNLFIPPMPDDSGISVGAALYVQNMIIAEGPKVCMRNNYWGPSYSQDQIEEELKNYKIHYKYSASIEKDVAQLISDGMIVGWFQGSLEFGDRSLGNRSILADPRNPAMKDKVNRTIKYRENFRPFAPSVLLERANELFTDLVETPYMEKVLKIKDSLREVLPAVTHVDGSCRLHTVEKSINPKFHKLISCFEEITQVPVLLNTSFNTNGEAMVCNPRDAIRTFYSSGLDVLAIGDFIILKESPLY
jgi:carbamoyltransferase